jgi:hypothetical protein
MKKCDNCGNIINNNYKFCPFCGHEIVIKPPKEYVGVPITKGIYRITFKPVELECSSFDYAKDIANHSFWGEDNEFKGFEIIKIASTVGPDKYPYVCGECGGVVVDELYGPCCNCGKNNWIRRGCLLSHETE